MSDSDEFALFCPLFPIDPSETGQFFANDGLENEGAGFSLGAPPPAADDDEWPLTPPTTHTDSGRSLMHRVTGGNPVCRKITPLRAEAGKLQKESRKQKLLVDREEAFVLKQFFLNYHVTYDKTEGHFSFEFEDAKPGSDKKAVDACNGVRVAHGLPGRRTPVTATHNRRNPSVKQPFYGKVRPLVRSLFNYKCDLLGEPLTEEDTSRYVDGCITEALRASFKDTRTPQRSPRGVHEGPGGSSVADPEILFASDKENLSSLQYPTLVEKAVSPKDFDGSDDATL